MSLLYRHSVIGGTFDFLHRGHQQLISNAFSSSNKVTIGIVSDKFAKKLSKEPYYRLKFRLATLNNFLKLSFMSKDYRVVIIDDLFGTTAEDATLDAVFVTEETVNGASAVNKRRAEQNLTALKVVKIPFEVSGTGEAISSTLIRKGLMNREGVSFVKQLDALNGFTLPREFRKTISELQGTMYKSIDDLISEKDISQDKLIVVGDESVKQFLSKGIVPRLSIIDFFIQRKRRFSSSRDLGFGKSVHESSAVNKAGTISSDSIRNIYELLGNEERIKNVLSISGEEDLCVIPCVLLAPLGNVVVYGQRNKGLVSIDIDEKKKNDFLKILAQFTRV